MVLALSTLPFLWNILHSTLKGKEAGDNPWRALTPEWLTSSPPPVENWTGEAPLIQEPYGYGKANNTNFASKNNENDLLGEEK